MELIIKPQGRNKCSRCGYDKCFGAIDFHHRDPKAKQFSMSTMWQSPITGKNLEELAKTVSLCKNCHAEEHWEKINEN